MEVGGLRKLGGLPMPCGHHGVRRAALLVLCALASIPLVTLTACQRPGRYVGAIPIAEGLLDPVSVAAPEGDTRLFVVERRGRVKVVDPVAKVVTGTYLDIVNRVSTGGERGLLAIAFAPDFAETGHLYALYQRTNEDTVLSRFVALDPSADFVSPATERILLSEQTASGMTALGGALRFGPDGLLYVGIGDSRVSPTGDTQLLRRLRGKILRIDVSGGPTAPYTIPPGNPFGPPFQPEIWAYGVHDPAQIDFDPYTGDLWVTDRGRGARDEVNLLPAGVGGLNLGSPAHEGNLCVRDTAALHCEDPNDPQNLFFPIHDVPRNPECGIVGSYAYGGTLLDLTGTFSFSDRCTSRLMILSPAAKNRPLRVGDATDVVTMGQAAPTNVVSIGSDGFGEPHVVSGAPGVVYRIQIGYDLDEDGLPEPGDNCPFVPNRDQLDSDENGIGDACEGEA
jgi:hypothetical protein